MLLLRCRILNIINFYTCIYIHILVCVTSSTLRTWRAVVDNIRWPIVGLMFLPSIFENRCGDFRRSMYRLSKIDDGCHDVSTFEDRCVDLRRSMCRPSKIDDRWSMCWPSKIDGRCEIRLLYLLKTLILYISCMRITPRVCTSVLSLSRVSVCLYVCMSVRTRYSGSTRN